MKGSNVFKSICLLICLGICIKVDAVTFGDFNHDGYADLVVGVPGENIGRISNAGAINIIYGSSQGLISTGNQFWHQDSPGIRNVAEAQDQFGEVYAVGDFNGDRFDDLAIGVPKEDIGTKRNAGLVHVLYGSSSSLTAIGSQVWHRRIVGIPDNPQRLDAFGYSLIAADFNNDGSDDLAIGIPYDSGRRGAVQILFGSAAGLTASQNQLWRQGNSAILDAPEAGDLFGWEMAAGDFDNNGFADLAIGVPFETIGSTEGGAVNIIYGSSAGLHSTGNQFWHQDSSGILDQAELGDTFGYSLAAGDFNDDAFDDLAIAVPAEKVGDMYSAGALNVLYGSSEGISSKNNQFLTQNTKRLREVSQIEEFFGLSVSVGDFNNNGFDDLAVGVPLENDIGFVQVIYGSSTGLSTTDQLWSEKSFQSGDVAEFGDLFGLFAGTGDFDGDGSDDLAAGIPYGDADADFDDGALQIIYGSPSLLNFSRQQFWTQNSPGIIDKAQSGDRFGTIKE